MSTNKLTRVTQKIFAGEAPADQLVEFGTAKTGTPVISSDAAALQSNPAYTQGYQDAVLSDYAPFLPETNALHYIETRQLAYLLQHGIPEWDANTVYFKDVSFCSYKGTIYKSLTDDNTGLEPDLYPENWEAYASGGGTESGSGIPIGTVIAHTCSADFTPENCLPCNGAEYTRTQFTEFYTNWLIAERLKTCTYSEYQQSIADTGACPMWGIDTAAQTFKVPTIPDGYTIQQAQSNAEIGKAYNAGLPNITGSAKYQASRGFIGTSAGVTSGAFQVGARQSHFLAHANDSAGYALDFNAALSNPIYGGSNTVQPRAVALRYFVVVSTGTINQAEMDWSQWATSLNNKVNINSNVIDGQWKTGGLVVGSLAVNATPQVFDISNIIPNDGYSYEAIVMLDAINSNNISVYVTSAFNQIAIRPTNVAQHSTNGVFIFDKDNRRIYMQTASGNGTVNNFIIRYYRRLGTNS